MEKYICYTPYQYGLLNPMNSVDYDGRIIVPEEIKKEYPNLAEYIIREFENDVMNNELIVDAFYEITGISKDDLREFVKNGSGPILQITDLGYDGKGKTYKRIGHWLSVKEQEEKNPGMNGPFKDILQMDKQAADKMEKALRMAKELQKNKKNKDAKRYKRVAKQYGKQILTHEIAHGAIEKTGKDTNDEDTGKLFEKKAYENPSYDIIFK